MSRSGNGFFIWGMERDESDRAEQANKKRKTNGGRALGLYSSVEGEKTDQFIYVITKEGWVEST